MEWKVAGTRFIELHFDFNGSPVSINPVGIAAFGVNPKPSNATAGAWIKLIGDSDANICEVSESYEQIKEAIQRQDF